MNRTDSTNRFGEELKRWRQLRKVSQKTLSHKSGFSARHLCFLETGRAQPSREAANVLAKTLGLSNAETNEFFQAAGFVATYRSEGFKANPHERHVVEIMLEKVEPYAAIVTDRQWGVLAMNVGATRMRNALVSSPLPDGIGKPNGILSVLLASDLLPKIENTASILHQVALRVRREALVDPEAAVRLTELASAFPNAKPLAPDAVIDVVMPVNIRHEDQVLRFYSFLTTFGTTGDAMAEETRIFHFFPADDHTKAWICGLQD